MQTLSRVRGGYHPEFFSILEKFGGLERDFFETFSFRRVEPSSASVVAPRFAFFEDGDELVLRAELPGARAERIEATIDRERLVIRGEASQSVPEGYVSRRRSRESGEFEHRVTLPCPIDAERVSATLERGVLIVTLPKAVARGPRRIPVRAVTAEAECVGEQT